MAVGGAGVVSVASNEAPAEMVQIVELCEKGDYAGARKLHHWLLPLIQVNFVESNPIPCKAAMAAMGLIDEVYRLPLVPPSPAAREKVMAVLQQLRLLGAARARVMTEPRSSEITALVRTGRRRAEGRRLARRSRGCARSWRRGASARPSPTPSSPTGWRVNVWVKQGILRRLPLRRRGGHGDRQGPLAVLRQGHAAAEGPVGGRAACASCRAARRSATAPTSARASSACRRCTSTSAPTWATARWSTRTRWWARARRSASACT